MISLKDSMSYKWLNKSFRSSDPFESFIEILSPSFTKNVKNLTLNKWYSSKWNYKIFCWNYARSLGVELSCFVVLWDTANQN